MTSSSDIKVGQQVVAIGNALGEGQSVTTGIISAILDAVSDEISLNDTAATAISCRYSYKNCS